MNILHLTYSLSKGGRRNAIESLAHVLCKNDISNFACTIHDFDVVQNSDIWKNIFNDVTSLNFHGRYLFNIHKILPQLKRICEKHNIDIIHSHDAASQVLAAIYRTFNKNSVYHVYTFHRSLNSDTTGFKKYITQYLC